MYKLHYAKDYPNSSITYNKIISTTPDSKNYMITRRGINGYKHPFPPFSSTAFINTVLKLEALVLAFSQKLIEKVARLSAVPVIALYLFVSHKDNRLRGVGPL